MPATAAQQRVSALIVRIQMDKAAAQMTHEWAQRISKDLDTIGLAGGSVRRVQSPVRAVTKDLQTMRKATQDVGKELSALEKRKISGAQIASGLSMSIGGRGIGGLVGRVGGAGAVQGIGITTDILDTARGLQMLKQQLPDLTEQAIAAAGGTGNLVLGLGIAGVAVAAIGLGMNELSKSTAKAKKEIDAQIAAIEQVTALQLGTKTAEDIQKEIAARKANIASEQDAIDELYDARNAWMDNQNALEGLVDTLPIVGGQQEKYTKKIEDHKQKIEESENAITLLNNALYDGTLVAAELAAQENALTDLRLKRIGAQTDAEIKAADQIKTATSEQLKARLAAIPAELEANQKAAERISGMMESMVPSSDEFKAAETAVNGYLDKVDALKAEQESLTNSILPLVQKREAEKKAIDDLTDALGKTADYAKKRGDLEKDFAEQTAETAAKRATELSREEEDYQRKRLHDIAGFNADLADFDRDFYEKRGDIIASMAEATDETSQQRLKDLAEFNKEDIRAAEDHARDMRQIQRDKDRAISDAAGSLDARAVAAAREKAKDELQTSQEQYDTEKKRRAEDFEDRLKELVDEREEKQRAYAVQLRDLQSQHNRERIDRINAFYTKLREEDQERTIALNRQKEDWRTEDGLRQTHFNSQLAALRDQYAKEIGETDVFFGNLQSLFIEGYQGILTAIGLMNAGSGGSTQALQSAINWQPGDQYIPHLQGGGRTPFGRDFMVGERGPEVLRLYQPGYVFPHGQGGGGGMNINIPINIEGGAAPTLLSRVQDQRNFKRAVTRAVVEVVEEFSKP